MVEISFAEETIGCMLDVFELEEDENGLVVNSKSGKHVEDAFGNKIESENVGGFIHLDSYDMTIRDDGRVLDALNEVITSGHSQEQSIIPVDEDTGILRDDFSSMVDYTEAQRVHENN